MSFMRAVLGLVVFLLLIGTKPLQAADFFTDLGSDFQRLLDKIIGQSPEETRIEDTEGKLDNSLDPAFVTPEEVQRFRSALGDDQSEITKIQAYLTDAGYQPGPKDGQIGPLTVSAIKRYWAAGQVAQLDVPELIEEDVELFELKESSPPDLPPGNPQSEEAKKAASRPGDT